MNYKGGRRKHIKGYILILKKDHPFSTKDGYVFEHRLIMEQKLGRYLTKLEQIHHINGIVNDNRIENLILFANNSDHLKYEYKHNNSGGIERMKKTQFKKGHKPLFINYNKPRDPITGRFINII